MRSLTSLVLGIPITFTISACSSGGSPKSVPPPPPAATSTIAPESIPSPSTSPLTTDFNTQEYQASNASVASNAIGAWQMGATGKGITIGFVDTGLVPIRTDFAGKVHPDSRDVAGNRPMDDTWGHGTAVAGIAAGAKDDRGMQGVAFDATIFMAKADQGCPDLCTFSADAVARGIDAARLAGAKVINLSIGGAATPEIENAARRAVEAGIILVVGSGNSGTAPSDFAQRLAIVAPNNVIIVGALGSAASDGSPISYDSQGKYSAPASSSKDHYLGAPGLYNAATYFRSDGIDRLSGSSFAAPVVSGALALLAQAFPTLSAASLIRILYATADDLGASGIDDVFGQGRLNIGRAFQPVGSVRVAGTDSPVRADNTISAPAAAGDAVYRSNLSTVVLDSFDRAFTHNLASASFATKGANPLASVLSTESRSSMIDLNRFKFNVSMSSNFEEPPAYLTSDIASRVQRSAKILATSAIARVFSKTSLAFGYKTEGASLRDQINSTSQSMSLTMPTARQHGLVSGDVQSVAVGHRWKNFFLVAAGEHGLVLTTSSNNKRKHYSSASGGLSYKIDSNNFTFALSHIRENSSLLGSDLLDLFGGGPTNSHYLDLGLSKSFLTHFALSANIRLGQSTTPAGTLRTRAVSLEASRAGIFGNNDLVMFNISQPLRVESGKLSYALPVSWDYYTKTAEIGNVALNMEPSGREVRTEIGYARYFAVGSIVANAYFRRQPDHVKTENADIGLALRGRLAF